jgi:hypothetical protein
MRMSHEAERAADARIHDEPDRAPSHWLNPLSLGVMVETNQANVNE